MGKRNKFEKRVKIKAETKVEKRPLTWQRKLSLATLLPFTAGGLLLTTNLFLADISFNNGDKAQRYGLNDQAVQNYQEAIFLNPHEPRYHRELAEALANLGKAEEAEREAEIAYLLNPKNSLTIRSLISTYSKLSELDEKYQTRTEELAAEAVKQQPTNPELYYEQALILLKVEKNDEAKESLKKALELKPDYQKARELLESFPQSPS